MSNSLSLYDVVVVGAGFAALTAAVFTARAQLKTLVIGYPEKSMLYTAQSVGNYIGTDETSGPDLLEKGIEQIQHYGAEFMKQEVIDIRKNKEGLFEVKTADNRHRQAKTVVIATGVSLKPAGIKNEDTLLGKGVHSCVACDGFFFKNKTVAVVGHANHAAQEAIELLVFTKNVSIISNGKEFDISAELMEELKKNNVQMGKDKIAEFKGEKRLEKIILKDGRALQFDGVFLALGTSTALAFAQKLALDTKDNFLIVDGEGKTSTDGIYAAGACVGGNLQIAKSAGEGCNVGIAIIRRLKGLANYSDLT